MELEAPRCVACYRVRSHPVPVALVGECSTRACPATALWSSGWRPPPRAGRAPVRSNRRLGSVRDTGFPNLRSESITEPTEKSTAIPPVRRPVHAGEKSGFEARESVDDAARVA